MIPLFLCLFTQDLPPLSDLHRFPPAPVVSGYRALNMQYRVNLEHRYSWDCAFREQIGATIIDTEKRYEVWDNLDDAQRQSHFDGCEHSARLHLARLRALIGEADYARGLLPAPVPLGRFRVID